MRPCVSEPVLCDLSNLRPTLLPSLTVLWPQQLTCSSLITPGLLPPRAFAFACLQPEAIPSIHTDPSLH